LHREVWQGLEEAASACGSCLLPRVASAQFSPFSSSANTSIVRPGARQLTLHCLLAVFTFPGPSWTHTPSTTCSVTALVGSTWMSSTTHARWWPACQQSMRHASGQIT
jgi:hypothetical protein